MAAAGISFRRVLVALETDATRYYGPDAVRPAVLDAGATEQMLAHLAADLERLFPEIRNCSLIAAGALFDQTELLRPGFPLYAALEQTAKPATADAFRPRLVSIGAAAGVMPDPALQPGSDLPLGPLQLLPLVVQGPAEGMQALGEAMEFRFLEEGQLSAHAASWLQTAFGVSLQHARLMTLTDLNAMLRLQLEHFGFLPLWELLDAGLQGSTDPLNVRSARGQAWSWMDGAAETSFQTFDFWANDGAGADQSAARMALAAGYADWTRELRQYLTTLRAHAIGVRFRLAGSGQALDGSWYEESNPQAITETDAAVTEHSFGDIGTVALTAVRDGRAVNCYPLRARGLNDIHQALGDAAAGGTVAFPGTILYDETTRRLRPDSVPV